MSFIRTRMPWWAATAAPWYFWGIVGTCSEIVVVGLFLPKIFMCVTDKRRFFYIASHLIMFTLGIKGWEKAGGESVWNADLDEPEVLKRFRGLKCSMVWKSWVWFRTYFPLAFTLIAIWPFCLFRSIHTLLFASQTTWLYRSLWSLVCRRWDRYSSRNQLYRSTFYPKWPSTD